MSQPQTNEFRSRFGEGPHVLGAVTLLARLAQEQIAANLTDFGLTFSQAVAMVRLWQTDDGSISQSDMIERLAVSRASGSLVLTELATLGLLTRSSDPADARRQIVRLTERGREIEPAVHAVFESVEAELFAPIDSEEWWTAYRQLRSAIDKLVAGRSTPR